MFRLEFKLERAAENYETMTYDFPFESRFDQRMGITPLPVRRALVACDERYEREVALKREQLAERHEYYFRAAPESELAQWEVVELLLGELTKSDSENFRFDGDASARTWSNLRLNETVVCSGDRPSELDLQPLDFVGRHVQEDLLILDANSILVAGQLCFANGWSLDEKFGRPFLELHAPLPSDFDPMVAAAGRFVARLPPGKSFIRANWAIRVSDRPDLSTRNAVWYRERLAATVPRLNDENAGEELFLRVEDQTLTRLPRSGAVLFTIRTTSIKIAEAISQPGRAAMLRNYMKTVPPGVLNYKLITPLMVPLMSYLDRMIKS